MPIYLPEKCLRGNQHCKPMAQIESCCGTSFVCCGENDGVERKLERDKYTVCFKNAEIDDEQHFDEIDIADTASVLVQALSIINHDRDNQDIQT